MNSNIQNFHDSQRNLHTSVFKRSLRKLAFIVPVVALAGCLDDGDGPEPIANSPAASAPVIPDGFCDAINFEPLCPLPGILNFNGGMTVVLDNPVAGGINTSPTVAQMTKRNEETFGGTRLDLAANVDFSAGEFFKMKVWASRAVPVTFKLEDSSNQFNIVERVLTHSGSSAWEELCFDFAGATAGLPVPAYTLIFDNGVLGQVGTDPANWTFYYDDIEQVTTCAAPPDPSITPSAGLVSRNGMPELSIPEDYAEITVFGSGSVLDPQYADDETFSPVLSVFSGMGYGANVAQVGFTGFRAGFLGAYESVNFKVKGDLTPPSAGPQNRSLPSQIVFVKLFDGADTLRINLTSSAFSEALENGWFQVSIPVSRFSGVAEPTGLVLESDNTSETQFRMLLTDIGFSGMGDTPPVVADPGTIPDDVIYATNPDEMVDIVFGVDYSGFDPFGSGSAFDNNVTTDADFSPAFGVTTGDGYGAQVGQFAIVGFPDGFAVGYDSLVFKAKNLNNDLIRVKFLPSDPYIDINLTSSGYSTALGNGWYQVEVPIADFTGVATANALLFETDNTAASAFTFLLTDFGFNGMAGGNPAITPASVVYATDPNVSVNLPPGGFDNFGSGAVFDANVMTDADYNPAFQVTSGEGYGEGVHVGFVAFTGFAGGFASNFETLHFKIKADAANLAAFEVKFFAPDTSQTYDLTTYAGAVDLGNGWLQVSIPMSDFAGNIASNDGFLIGPFGAQAAPFSYLLTDIGFDDAANVSPAITPDSVVYATDPNVTVSLPPGGFDNFGSGANFDGMFTGDADFNPAFQVTSGEGYGEGVHVGFVAFTGFGAGFASNFETLHFKIKADAANLAAFEVKFFAPDTSQTYDLTTYSGAVDLGNGWLQVSIPMSDFAENIAANDGFLVGPLGAQAAPFSYLLTDIGFSGGAQ